MRDHRGILNYRTDLFPHLRQVLAAEKLYAPAAGSCEPHSHTNQSSFASAIFTDKSINVTAVHGHGNVVYCLFTGKHFGKFSRF